MQPQYSESEFQQFGGVVPVEHLGVAARSRFIVKTYLHLLGAVLAFTGIEVFLFTTGMAEGVMQAIMSAGPLVMIGGFILVAYGASHVAHNVRSMPLQYLALAAFVVFEALFFTPLLMYAQEYAAAKDVNVISNAVGVTIIGFLGLTMIVFGTRKDFSFLRGLLFWGFFVAIALILGSVIFGFELGTLFFAAMIAYAGGAILYDTSNVLHHYPEDRYVAASLELFAGVAMMFWYILRLFMSRD